MLVISALEILKAKVHCQVVTFFVYIEKCYLPIEMSKRTFHRIVTDVSQDRAG